MPTPPAIRHARKLAAVILLGLLVSAAVVAHRPPREPDQDTGMIWREAAWRMPLDNWGQGRAWRATGPGGTEVLMLARTKTGFCNCFEGIADDTEIDRIGDVDLHGDSFTPAGPGEATSMGGIPGRKRLFRAADRWNGTRHVVSIVAATDCKAVVATIVSDDAITPAAEASAIAVLTGEPFRQWAANQ